MTAKVLDGRYKLIKALGAGGFGRTYIARDMRRPGSPACVVKHLQPASSDPGFIKEARRLFNTEAETLEKLGSHNQIPQLLAYFEEEKQFYLVQEYIEGRSLQSEFVNRESPEPDSVVSRLEAPEKRLTETEVIAILKDLLGILHFVHSEGVIHRDIKPDNIIRRKKDNKLVLIDFGAVKALQGLETQVEGTGGESRFTVTIGTPGYMPSEQSIGRPNFTSDLYAVGMIGIKALTGLDPTSIPTDPLTGELIWRDRAKVTNLSGTLLDEIKISNGLAMVLTRMVRYQHTQRYQSAKEALQGLGAFTIAEEPQKPLTSSVPVKVVKSQTKSAETASGFLIAGLVLMVGATIIYLSNLPKAPQTPIVVTAAPTISAANPTPASSPPIASTSPIAPTSAKTPEDVSSFSQTLGLQAGQETVKEGKLKINQILTFTLSGEEGQTLGLEASGGISMVILAPNQEPVDPSASQVTSWNGKLPYTGEYKIQLKSTNPESEYKLKAILTASDLPTPAPTN